MANDAPDYTSVTGQMETAEPPNGGSAGAASGAQKRSPSQQRQTSSQSPSASVPPLRKQRSSNLVPSASPSAGSSPHTSRNASPIRRDSRPPANAPIATQPSAAAIQRALSAASVPQLPASGPVTDAVSRLPRASKTAAPGSGDTTPQWPMSPRLKSPPPSIAGSRRGSAQAPQKKAESMPSISVQSATPQTATPSPRATPDDPKRVEQLQAPPPKPVSRGPSGKSTLETVQENSSDTITEPPAAVQAAADLKPLTKITEEDKASSSKREGPEPEKHTQHGESGSESAGSKLDRNRGRRQSLTQPKTNNNNNSRPTNSTKSSYTPLQSAKSRQQSESKHNMTVETETVQSIPQSALNPGDRNGSGRNDPSGSIRLKPSNETIRPKKERKKPAQKARSINQGTGTYRSPLLIHRDSFEDVGDDSTVVGSSYNSSVDDAKQRDRRKLNLFSFRHWPRALTFSRPSYSQTSSNRRLRKASSKADIFEARVASAVEQENTSDSDETFVYESNPPEPQRRPRHHSRTPSVTSAHSMADQQRGGIRNFGDMLDEQRKVAGKRSMKFSNNPYHDDSPDSKNGTVRSHQARHFGKFGRGGSQGMYDPDSPFTQASKLRTGHMNMRQSRPNSPRSPQSLAQQQQHRPSGLFSGRKTEQSFDFDGEGADDERTPLVGTVRTPRGATRHRRHESGQSNSIRSIDEYYGVRRHGRCGRFGGCMLGMCVLGAVILSAVALLVMSNRPLQDVCVRRIQNVLASEQEIMLDLYVGAVNPNALSITVMDMDMNVFAKSSHVGSELDPPAHDHSGSAVGRMRQRRGSGVERVPAKAGNPNPWQDMSGHWHAPEDGVDRGTDPFPPDDDGDLEKDAQTMLLGRITHFDQALAFEGSPIKRHQHFSIGELRLSRPGNKTEAGGSERWERTLLHPFELIVRGVLKYQLPVSMRLQSVSVSASVIVHPEDGIDKAGNMRLEPISHKNHWQWIDWEKVKEVEGEPRVAEVVEEG